MEYIIGMLIFAIISAFYFKNKADKAMSNELLGRTRGQDIELKDQQDLVDKAISDIDKRLSEIKDERKLRRKQAEILTDKERADKWDK